MKFSTSILTEKLQSHFFADTAKHSEMTNQTVISVIPNFTEF